jgi:ankyrin repeat protein
MLRWFVEEYAANINHQNDYKETPLMHAAREGKLETV